MSAIQKTGDGVRLALLSNRFEGIARKMANTLMRTARSGVISIARDFSCCIVTSEHMLLSAADSLPIHVLSGPDLMAASMLQFHPQPARGDAFLHNSPYHGCSHPADHTILIPVLDDQGVHRYTVLAKAHQADCGNAEPSTYVATARDVYAEGAPIFPAVKVQQNYRNIDDIVRMCRMRIRVPDQWEGDFQAMLGAARIGERELLELGRDIGWDALKSYEQDYFNYSEQRMAAAIQALPAGGASWTSVHDALPGSPEGAGIPIKVELEVDSIAGRIRIDLRDNPDCVPLGINLSEACSRTAAMVGVFNSLPASVPKNAGSFRRIDVALRENCIAGTALHPSSCSAATTNIADRVANGVQCAFAELADGIGLAECGGIIPAGDGVISGRDPVTGKPFVNQIILGVSGGAGAPQADAWQLIGHVGNAGRMFIDSIELDELRQPIFIAARHFVKDSEGPGRHVGASSLHVEFGPTGSSFDLAYGCDGVVNVPRGVRGGSDGAGASQSLRSAEGISMPLPAWGVVTVHQGEMVLSYSCGGGGYGPARSRDAEAVAAQVAQGWISAGRAREMYGVVLTPEGDVDPAATAVLRKAEA